MRNIYVLMSIAAVFPLSSLCSQWLDTLDLNSRLPGTVGHYIGTQARISAVHDSIIMTDLRFKGQQNIASQVYYMMYHNPNGDLLRVDSVPLLGNIHYKPSRTWNIPYRHHGYIIRTEDAFPPIEPPFTGFVAYNSGSILWSDKVGRYQFLTDIQSKMDSTIWVRNEYEELIKINLLTGHRLDTVNLSNLIIQLTGHSTTQSASVTPIDQRNDTLYAMMSYQTVDSNNYLISNYHYLTLNADNLSIFDSKRIADPINSNIDPYNYAYVENTFGLDIVDSTYTIHSIIRSLKDSALLGTFSIKQSFHDSIVPSGLVEAKFSVRPYISSHYVLWHEKILVEVPGRPGLLGRASRLHLYDRNGQQLLYRINFEFDENQVNNYLTQVELNDDGSVYAIMNVNVNEEEFALIKIDTTGNYSLSNTNYEAEEAELQFRVFPNPFQSSIQIETSRVGNYQLKLYNLSGQLVEKWQAKDKQFFTFNTENIVPGMYFYQLENMRTGAMLKTGKLIKRE